MPTVAGITTDTKTEKKTSSSSARMSGNVRLNTISKRNHAAGLEVETLLWRALCDSPDAAKEYMSEDCVMINPLFSGSPKPMSKTTDPSIEEVLKGAEPWTSFRMHDEPEVVEIDLMAIAVLYTISLYRHGKKGKMEEVVATGSSSWRQTAGADWLLVAHHVSYAD